MRRLSQHRTLRFFVSLLFLFQLVLMDLPVGDLQARPLRRVRRRKGLGSSEQVEGDRPALASKGQSAGSTSLEGPDKEELVLSDPQIGPVVPRQPRKYTPIQPGPPQQKGPESRQDIYPPEVEFTSPGECVIIDTNTPLITLTYSDDVMGVDPRSVQVIVNGNDYTSLFDITADQASYQVTPESPLPEGENVIEISLSDWSHHATMESFSFGVDTAPGGMPPVLSCSSFLDGVVYDASTDGPLSGMMVTVSGIDGEVYTDSAGKYVFPVPYSGTWDVTLMKDQYTVAHRQVESVATRDAAPAPAYLVPFDAAVTEITMEGGTHINSSGDIEIDFPPGSVSDTIDVQSTRYERSVHLPDTLPSSSFFTYAIDLEPGGATFDSSVTARIANTLGFPPGTQIPVGVFNDSTGRWEDTGLMGTVTADSQWVEFQVDHFSPYDINNSPGPPPDNGSPMRGGGGPSGGCGDCDMVARDNVGSSIDINTGQLIMDHQLPSVRSLSRSSALSFAYHSLSADPSVMIYQNTKLDTLKTKIPKTTTFKINMEGVSTEATYEGVAGDVRYAYLFDGRNGRDSLLTTGSYPYTVEVSNNFDSLTYWTSNSFGGAPLQDTGVPTIEPVPVTTTIKGRFYLNNQQDSPFGAGWTLDGLQRLHFDPDGTIFLTDGYGGGDIFHHTGKPISDLAVACTDNNAVLIYQGLGDGTLQDITYYAAGQHPTSVATGDFNGDGSIDLAVSNGFGDDLSILIGNGDGTFQPPVNYSGPTNGYFIAVGDFNNDTNEDIALIDSDYGGSYGGSIFLGDGSGAFQYLGGISIGQDPRSIAVGHFDGDGIEDLAVANMGDDNVSILIGNGDGSFQDPHYYSAGDSAWSVMVGDFNGDLFEDLAVANAGDDSVTIRLGNGDGTFQARSNFYAGNSPRSIIPGDFNGDGNQDLVTANYRGNNISVLFGNGDGTFQEPVKYGTNNENPVSIKAGDLDGDGIADLAVVNEKTGNVSILKGNGDGTFEFKLSYAAGIESFSLAIGDFNGDDSNDLAIADNYDLENPNDDVPVLLNDGNGYFDSPLSYRTQPNPGFISIGDFNNDDKGDIVVTVLDNLNVYLGNGDGTFQQRIGIGSGNNPNSVAVGDFDRNDTQDLGVTLGFNQPPMVYLGTGEGTFRSPDFLFQYCFAPSQAIISITSNDFNGDAIPDLASICQHNIRIYLGNGDGSFTQGSQYSLGNVSPNSIRVGDFNNDGAKDIVTANLSGDNVSVLIGNGDGTFQAPANYLAGNEPRAVVIGDFNGDDKEDLAVANLYSDDVSILLGKGDGTFQEAVNYPAGGGPLNISVSDFDGDYNDDIVVLNSWVYNENLSVLFGRGDGSFDLPVRYSTGYRPQGIAVGNFNNDYYEEWYAAEGIDKSILKKNPDGTYTRTLEDGTEINFNQDGYETSIVDRNGNATHYEYSDERLTRITDPTNRSYQFTYDPSGSLQSVTDPAGRVTRFVVDGNGDLVQIINPDSTSVSYSYEDHLLRYKTDERGYTTEYQYDPHGRISRVIFPTGETRQYFPSDVYGLINDLPDTLGTPEDPAPVVRPEEVHDFVIDERGNQWTYRTDRYGGLLEVTDPLGRTTTYERDEDSNPWVVTRPNGSSFQMTYDDYGNLVRYQENYDDATTIYTYDPNYNLLTSIQDPLGNVTRVEYDSTTGKPLHVINALGDTTFMEYDDRGLMTMMVTACCGDTIRFFYDSGSGNLVGMVNPLGDTTWYDYDSAGNLVMVKDPLGRETHRVYDSMNRLIRIIDAMGDTTVYEYDEAGNMTRITDAKGNVTTFDYDLEGLLTKIKNPLGDSTLFFYDMNRNLDTLITFNGDTIAYTYDEANQLVEKHLPGGEVVTYSYDQLGNRKTASDLDSDLEFTYDPLGRLIEAKTLVDGVQPVTTIKYSYDKNNNRMTMVDPQADTTSYSYDALNRLILMFNPMMDSTMFSYSGSGPRQSLHRSNGIETDYEYGPANRLLGIYHIMAGDTLSYYTYDYNSVGDKVQMEELQGIHDYTYDDIDQLIQATHPTIPTEYYNYDPVGNRTTHGSVYNEWNQLLEDSLATYSYDRNGNLTLKVDKATTDSTRYTYDAENRLTRIDHPDGTYSAYRYDALGRRIEKDVNGTITRFIYDGDNILEEYDGSNVLAARYTHGPGIDEPLAMERTGQVYYHLADALGSVTALTDSNGQVVQTYLYDSFGNIIDQTGSVLNFYTYTGREYDAESGLYYYRARYYDAGIGRFLQVDPIGFIGGSNLYYYVGNGPTNFKDSYGLQRNIPVPGNFPKALLPGISIWKPPGNPCDFYGCIESARDWWLSCTLTIVEFCARLAWEDPELGAGCFYYYPILCGDALAGYEAICACRYLLCQYKKGIEGGSNECGDSRPSPENPPCPIIYP